MSKGNNHYEVIFSKLHTIEQIEEKIGEINLEIESDKQKLESIPQDLEENHFEERAGFLTSIELRKQELEYLDNKLEDLKYEYEEDESRNYDYDYISEITDSKKLEELSHSKVFEVKLKVSNNEHTPLSALKRLIEDGNEYVIQTIEDSVYTPLELKSDDFILDYFDDETLSKELMVELSTSDNEYVKLGVAEHPNTPIEVLEKLSNDESEYVRTIVAENPNTPIETLEKLSNEDIYKNGMISREGLDYNPNCPIELKSDDFKYDLLEDKDLSIETLEILSRDTNEFIRGEVAKHPNTPLEVLKKLSNDNNEDYEIEINLDNNPNFPLELKSDDFQVDFFNNKDLSSEELVKYSNSENGFIKILVAEHPNTPIEVLEKLSNDKHECVRNGVEENSNYIRFKEKTIEELIGKEKDEQLDLYMNFIYDGVISGSMIYDLEVEMKEKFDVSLLNSTYSFSYAFEDIKRFTKSEETRKEIILNIYKSIENTIIKNIDLYISNYKTLYGLEIDKNETIKELSLGCPPVEIQDNESKIEQPTEDDEDDFDLEIKPIDKKSLEMNFDKKTSEDKDLDYSQEQ